METRRFDLTLRLDDLRSREELDDLRSSEELLPDLVGPPNSCASSMDDMRSMASRVLSVDNVGKPVRSALSFDESGIWIQSG